MYADLFAGFPTMKQIASKFVKSRAAAHVNLAMQESK